MGFNDCALVVGCFIVWVVWLGLRLTSDFGVCWVCGSAWVFGLQYFRVVVYG